MSTTPTIAELTYPTGLVGVSSYIHRLADHPDLAERLVKAGFHTLSRTEVIGHGHADMSRCVANLLSGRAHRNAGAPLTRDSELLDDDHPLAPGDVVSVTPGGRLLTPLASPCLVISSGRHDLDLADNASLSDTVDMIYGTLPGHLECGEERFAVTLENDGTVTATVSAFSRPGRLITRVGGPVARYAQKRMSARYIRGMASHHAQ